jgi:hypothetical protein
MAGTAVISLRTGTEDPEKGHGCVPRRRWRRVGVVRQGVETGKSSKITISGKDFELINFAALCQQVCEPSVRPRDPLNRCKRSLPLAGKPSGGHATTATARKVTVATVRAAAQKVPLIHHRFPRHNRPTGRTCRCVTRRNTTATASRSIAGWGGGRWQLPHARHPQVPSDQACDGWNV